MTISISKIKLKHKTTEVKYEILNAATRSGVKHATETHLTQLAVMETRWLNGSICCPLVASQSDLLSFRREVLVRFSVPALDGGWGPGA